MADVSGSFTHLDASGHTPATFHIKLQRTLSYARELIPCIFTPSVPILFLVCLNSHGGVYKGYKSVLSPIFILTISKNWVKFYLNLNLNSVS